MSKDLQQDGLEDFLKKSFDGFSDNPSDAVWDGISAELGTPAPARPGFSISRWWLAAAVFAVLAIFTCQHLYFQHRIKNLEKSIEKQIAHSGRTEKETTNPSQTPEQVAQLQAPNIISSSTLSDLNTGTVVPQDKKEDKEKAEPPATVSSLEPVQNEVKSIVTNEGLPAQILPRFSKIPILPGRQLTNISAPQTVNLLFLQPAQHLSQAKSLGASFHVMPMYQKSTVSGNRPSGPHQHSSEERTAEGYALYTGATVERRWGKHFSLISGMDYLHSEFAANHTVDFKFMDGNPIHMPGGTHDHEHEFEYVLNSSSGELEVQLRVSEVDTNYQIPEHEKLEFEVDSRVSNNYLTFPLAAEYRLGHRRFHGFLRAGLLANILLNSKYSIEDIRISNPHLKLEKLAPPVASQPNLQRATFDYLASAGVGYQLTPRIQIQAGPAIVGSISKQNTDRNLTTSRNAIGLNANLSILF